MTRKTLVRVLLALSVAGAVVFFAWPSKQVRAGYTQSQQCSCYAVGAGQVCAGSLQCFRDLPDSGAFARFSQEYLYGQTNFDFAAVYNNTYYTCSVRDSQRAQQTANVISGLTPRDNFWVYWDGSGECQEVYVYKFSDFLQ